MIDTAPGRVPVVRLLGRIPSDAVRHCRDSPIVASAPEMVVVADGDR